jgi:hypothetical protein
VVGAIGGSFAPSASFGVLPGSRGLIPMEAVVAGKNRPDSGATMAFTLVRPFRFHVSEPTMLAMPGLGMPGLVIRPRQEPWV